MAAAAPARQHLPVLLRQKAVEMVYLHGMAAAGWELLLYCDAHGLPKPKI